MNKRLNNTDRIGPCDSVVIWSGDNQDFRAVPVDTFTKQIQEGVTLPDAFNIQHFNPGASFALDIENDERGTYLILNPSATIAAGTLTLPEKNIVKDGQSLLVASSKAVTALTIAGNNALVIGGPTTIAAGGFFKLKYDKLSNTWYRVG
ncbi:hypothetical protein ACT4X4_03055 [Acinetobacter baumannii]